MTTADRLLNARWEKAWHAIRFILFGVGGFWIMMLFWVEFLVRVKGDVHFHDGFVSPFLSLPLIFVGAVMMLIGVGEWGRWGYLWVFLSVPVSLSSLFLMPESFWSLSIVDAKLFGITVCGVAVGVASTASYRIVRRYYRHKHRVGPNVP